VRRLPIPLTGQHKQHRSLAAANQITQNMYTEILKDDQGKDTRILLSCPGKSLVLNVSGSPIRCIHTVSGVNKYWAVAGDKFYEILNNNTYSIKGSLATSSSPVYMADNGTHILIVDGSNNGYVYEIATGNFTDDLHAIAPAFIGGSYVVSIGGIADGYGFFIVIQPNTNVLQSCTAPYGTAPTTWDALDEYSTTLDDGGILKALGVLFGQLWAIGEFNTVVFSNTGNPTGFPLSPVIGAPIAMGISAAKALQMIDNSLIWPAQTKKGAKFIVRASGYVPVKISQPEHDTQISKYSTIADADSISYTDEGHSFYCISFPTGKSTLVFDCSTGEWHTRSSLVNGVQGVDNINSYAYFNGVHLAGNRYKGDILKLSLDTYDDNGSPLVRKRRTQHLKEGMNPIEIAALYVDIEVGVGLQGDVQGYDPQIVLRYSRDGGKTWSEEMYESIGKIGEYFTQVRFPRLGMGTDWVFELMVSDPVPVTILGGYIEV
jgi:hypothetical protein